MAFVFFMQFCRQTLRISVYMAVSTALLAKHMSF